MMPRAAPLRRFALRSLSSIGLETPIPESRRADSNITSGWDQLERGGAGYSYNEQLLTKMVCGFMPTGPSTKTIRSFPRG
jgi:hypothetical protein